MTIDIQNGEASSLTEDVSLFEGFEQVVTRRYSHIWPKSLLLRLAFRVVRKLTSEKGCVSDWTRRWRCVWQVRLAASPRVVRFESASRQACVDWEHANLEATL